MRLPRERFDYSPIAARRPWKLPKGARIAVWTIVNIEEWDIEKPHGPPVPDGAAGRGHRARRAELGLARLRDARGLLAAARRADQAQDPRHHGDQRARVPSLRARRARHARRAAGSSWATASSRAPCTCCPTSAPPFARPIETPARLHREEAQGLARPRTQRDVGNARRPGRGGHRVRLRLGERRPALRDPHDGRAARVGALHARAERHPDDGDPAPRVEPRGSSAPATSSTASTPRARRTRASWRSPSTRTSRACPTASSTSRRSTTT